MEPEEIKKEELVAEVLPQEASSERAPREFKKNGRKPAPRREARVKPEFDQKIIDIRIVS